MITFPSVLTYQISIVFVISEKKYMSGLQMELDNHASEKLVQVLCYFTCYIKKELNKTSEDMMWHVVWSENVCLFHSQRVICPSYIANMFFFKASVKQFLVFLVFLLPIQNMWWFIGRLKLCNLPHPSDCMEVSRNRTIVTSQMSHHMIWVATLISLM